MKHLEASEHTARGIGQVVALVTFSRNFVTLVSTPRFSVRPDSITWGSRTFFLDEPNPPVSLKWHTKHFGDVEVYTEGFAYTVVESAPSGTIEEVS